MDLWALSDLCTPWCILVASTLRVAQHIDAGIHDIEPLAAAAGADSDALQRVIRHLVSKGIFEETAPGRFAVNDAAKGLLDPGLALGLDLEGIGGRMAYSWSTLLKAVRTGRPAYSDVFGRPYWEDLDAHPDVAESFDALMGPGHGVPDPEVLLNPEDWKKVRAVVDVGGGTGALLAEVLRAHPDIRGHPGGPPPHGGPLPRCLPGSRRQGSCHDFRPKLLRPAARRRRPLPDEECPQRLARRGGPHDPDPMRGGRPPVRRPPGFGGWSEPS